MQEVKKLECFDSEDRDKICYEMKVHNNTVEIYKIYSDDNVTLLLKLEFTSDDTLKVSLVEKKNNKVTKHFGEVIAKQLSIYKLTEELKAVENLQHLKSVLNEIIWKITWHVDDLFKYFIIY